MRSVHSWEIPWEKSNAGVVHYVQRFRWAEVGAGAGIKRRAFGWVKLSAGDDTNSLLSVAGGSSAARGCVAAGPAVRVDAGSARP